MCCVLCYVSMCVCVSVSVCVDGVGGVGVGGVGGVSDVGGVGFGAGGCVYVCGRVFVRVCVGADCCVYTL